MAGEKGWMNCQLLRRGEPVGQNKMNLRGSRISEVQEGRAGMQDNYKDRPRLRSAWLREMRGREGRCPKSCRNRRASGWIIMAGGEYDGDDICGA